MKRRNREIGFMNNISQFAIVYDDAEHRWKAVHQFLEEEDNKISAYGSSPVDALKNLIEKFSTENIDPIPAKVFTAASTMENIMDVIKNISEFKNPHIELSFKEGDIGMINGELLGMYLGPWTKAVEDDRGFLLCHLDAHMNVYFKLKLFDDKQLSNIEIIDHVDNYNEYIAKYADQLKKRDLL